MEGKHPHQAHQETRKDDHRERAGEVDCKLLTILFEYFEGEKGQIKVGSQLDRLGKNQ